MTPADRTVFDSIDHLFRHHAGQMVAVLVRRFGVGYIDLVEDSVQDALLTAMKRWPYSGVPENQTAWLVQVAKNRMVDRLRRDSRSGPIEDAERQHVETADDPARFAGELDEDQIRMIFACCHPVIPADSRVALTLKIVGGFSVAEIARAYLAGNDAVAKMLTRAKNRLRDAEVEIPAGSELAERLDSVLRVLYLMFNEGYSASAGPDLIRRDLCFEAIRLVELLLAHPLTSMPKVFALASLFFFQAARLGTRTDAGGDLLLLPQQDRALWDREMLANGLDRFRRAAAGDELSDYHLEAEIASLHALAPSYETTDWPRIIRCYDLLLERTFSPVVALNRVVAVGEMSGPEPALRDLSGLAGNYLMTSFDLFHITRGHFLASAGNRAEAVRAFQRADELAGNDAVRRFIRRRIEMLTSSE